MQLSRGAESFVNGTVCWIHCDVWSEALLGCWGKWGVWSGFSSSRVYLTTWKREERKMEKREEKKLVQALLGSVWDWTTQQTQWGGFRTKLKQRSSLAKRKIKHDIPLFICNVCIFIDYNKEYIFPDKTIETKDQTWHWRRGEITVPKP